MSGRQQLFEQIAIQTTGDTLTGQAAIDYLSIDRNNDPAWQAEVAAREQAGINMVHVGSPVTFREVTPYPITGGQAMEERSY